MATHHTTLHLPSYQDFINSIAVLALPFSASELHGVMCGYLCAGSISEGEAYIRALITNKNDAVMRVALFGVYTVSQQQMLNFDFDFQLLLPPDEDTSLAERAKAFSEWCEGFTQGLTLAGVEYEQLQEDDAQEALQHITEFAQLDYHTLSVNEEDEQALMEVTEYARLAVLRIHGDLLQANGQSQTAH